MDGTTKVGRLLLVAQGAERKARGRVQHHSARGHHHGLPQRVLRAPPASGEWHARFRSLKSSSKPGSFKLLLWRVLYHNQSFLLQSIHSFAQRAIKSEMVKARWVVAIGHSICPPPPRRFSFCTLSQNDTH